MFLSANTRPDIAYAVHQAARFTHFLRASHAAAVKRILRYLSGTRDKCLYLDPLRNWQVDTYVDSDFAGLYAVEHPEDSTSVKSRTGYIILYQGCPLLWVSRLQTLIALSTVKAEYMALSQSMRDLISIREILKELNSIVLPDHSNKSTYTTYSKVFKQVPTTTVKAILPTTLSTQLEMDEYLPTSKVYKDNTVTLKYAQMPKISPRTKHIGIPYHWFRTKIINTEVTIEPVSTKDQHGDIFTKGLPKVPFEHARHSIMRW